MLNNKQKKNLKALAHKLKPLVNIGKGELSEDLIKNVSRALFDHELIKVKALQSVETPIKELGTTLAEKTEAELVHIIGHTVILYKRSAKENIEPIQF